MRRWISCRLARRRSGSQPGAIPAARHIVISEPVLNCSLNLRRARSERLTPGGGGIVRRRTPAFRRRVHRVDLRSGSGRRASAVDARSEGCWFRPAQPGWGPLAQQDGSPLCRSSSTARPSPGVLHLDEDGRGHVDPPTGPSTVLGPAAHDGAWFGGSFQPRAFSDAGFVESGIRGHAGRSAGARPSSMASVQKVSNLTIAVSRASLARRYMAASFAGAKPAGCTLPRTVRRDRDRHRRNERALVDHHETACVLTGRTRNAASSDLSEHLACGASGQGRHAP